MSHNTKDGLIFLTILLVLGFGVTCAVQWGTGGESGEKQVEWWSWQFFVILWPCCTFITTFALGFLSFLAD